MISIIADSNIAHLHDYFNAKQLGVAVTVKAMAGRDIDADIIKEYQPDALLIRSVTQVNSDLLNYNQSVKFVGSATIGTDHVDQDYLAKQGVIFNNAMGCSKHSVAQYVMTAIFTLRPQYWDSVNASEPIKLGIIGLGNIGSTLAKYAEDLGWQVLGYDPFLSSSGINNATLDEVLTQSDIISLHVPLTTESTSQLPTYHLIDDVAFAKMPTHTILINTARGSVINESALLADLATTNRTVILDVFEHEPVVSIQLLEKLAIATPHIAGYTLEGKLRGTQMIFDAFVQAFSTQVEVTNLKTMQQLLPNNPYRWQQLKNNPDSLAGYYNIKADDALLREAIDVKQDIVTGADFDALRKNYALRREWLFHS